MAQETGQERTEQPTQKRLNEAREKGQVARSRELNTMTMLLASSLLIVALGPNVIQGVGDMMVHGLSYSREDALNTSTIYQSLYEAFISAFASFSMIFLGLIVVAIISPLLLSGWTFSFDAMMFKADRINPITGMGRIFSWKALLELVKSLGKFALFSAISIIMIWIYADDILMLGRQSVEVSLAQSGHIMAISFLMIAAGMVVIAAIDVPFQIWDHAKQLKMTKQEIKEEYKETDGHPEIRGKIRQMQREMAKRRMMAAVPKADVVVTNPTHYAVALKYDQMKMRAPIVLAKGADLVAEAIRTVAADAKVPILSAPPLARALFYSTEINEEIPSGLYLAVAQLLAYVYQLRRSGIKQRQNPKNFDDLPIPDELRRN